MARERVSEMTDIVRWLCKVASWYFDGGVDHHDIHSSHLPLQLISCKHPILLPFYI